MNDLHATMLRLFGIDHKQLTYGFQGRDFRLTDVAGQVIQTSLLRKGLLPVRQCYLSANDIDKDNWTG